MSFFKNDSELYAYAIHAIYAVILASSFDIANQLFIPVSNVDTWFERIRTYAIFFTYVVLISGWLGYAKSISYRKHRGSLGRVRFILDLTIVFLVFYLINLTRDETTFTKHFAEVFIFLLPILFAVYALWDWIKLREYKPNPKRTVNKDKMLIEDKINYTGLVITLIFAVPIIIQSIIYGIISQFYDPFGNLFLFPIVTTSSLVIILGYRYVKWNRRR